MAACFSVGEEAYPSDDDYAEDERDSEDPEDYIDHRLVIWEDYQEEDQTDKEDEECR